MTLRILTIFVTVKALCFAAPAVAAQPVFSAVDVFGRFVYEYAFANGENTDFNIDDDEIRTARIGVSGIVAGWGEIKAELATDSSGEVRLTDLYIQGKPFGGDVSLRVGQFKTPNSLDEETSSRFTSLNERPSFTDAFELNRRVGVALLKSAENHSLFIGFYGQNLKGEKTFGGYAAAARATYMPVSDENMQVHTGISVRYRDRSDDQPDFRYRQRPFTHNSARIVGTERLGAADFFAGAEFAVTYGGAWVTGEYAVTFVNCSACIDNPTLAGGYLEAGVMIGGRRRLKGARFTRPEINRTILQGGLGAVTLVARFDQLDLNSGEARGGAYNAFAVGSNWWPTNRIRISANGFLANADFGSATSGVSPVFTAAVASGLTEEQVLGVDLRAQFDF